MAVGARLVLLRRISAGYRELEKSEKLRMGLTVIDSIAHELLTHPDMSGVVSTKQMRVMLRYKAGIKGLTGLSSHIHAAVNMLLRERILENVPRDIGEYHAEGDSPLTFEAARRRFTRKKAPVLEFETVAQTGAKRRGRKCYSVRKHSWTGLA